MPQPLEPDDLAALLAVAADDADAAVRVAALDAASRFPLDLPAWRAVAQSTMKIANTEPPGSNARRAALALAVRIPLRTLREHLRRMARSDEETDRATLTHALDEAGDPSRIGPLIEAASGADAANAFRWLAGMPVEEVIGADEVPPAPADSTAQFWRALVLSRLGRHAALDRFLSGQADEPGLFWGSPWAAYDAIASIRPVPAPMRSHLLKVVAGLDAGPAPVQASHAERLARLTAWAATGVADAEGHPLGAAAPTPPEAGHASPSSEQVAQARSVRAQLPAALFEHRLQAPERQALNWLPQIDVAPLVRDVVAEGNRRRFTQWRDAGPAWPGNDIVELAMSCPPADDWPTAELVAEQLRAPKPALDDGQLAWMLARDDRKRLIGTLAGMVTPERSQAERLRILHLLALAADSQGGRAGSPMRGAGPGSGVGAGHTELLDDEPRSGAKHIGEPAMPTAAMPDVDMPTAGAEPVAAAAPPRAPAAVPPGPEERTVNAVILNGTVQRKTFVAGADNTIRCWIGLPQPGVASAKDCIPPVFIPPEGLPLLVQLSWLDSNGEQHTASQPMLLPASRTARSGDCDLPLHVSVGEPFVAADIVFRYNGRVFEIVRLAAFALAAGEAEDPQHEIKITAQTSRREVIALADSQTVHDVFVFGDAVSGSAGLLQFGAGGGHHLKLDDADTAIRWLNTELHAAETLVVRRQAARKQSRPGVPAPPDTADELDSNDPDVLRLLREMARHGAGLYQQLVEQAQYADPGERIQVVNQNPATYVPLEFVYDGGYPKGLAPLCRAGIDALKGGADTCPQCTLPAPAALRTAAECICPFGFWSLRKVIERVSTAEPGQASTPQPDRRSLPVIDAVAFASSHLVPEDERKATQEALQKSFSGCYLAETWHEWKAAVSTQHPPLLVVLPHHGVQASLDYLEIGDAALGEDDGKLSRAQISPPYVNPDRRDPGPIVLMLGCQTAAQTETGYVQMTLRIQQQHAAIVLGTLAEVLGRHAAPVARAIVAELVAVDDPGADFGTIMRRVRRRMLARGYLMALCLVALGDAEWRLTPRKEPSHAEH